MLALLLRLVAAELPEDAAAAAAGALAALVSAAPADAGRAVMLPVMLSGLAFSSACLPSGPACQPGFPTLTIEQRCLMMMAPLCCQSTWEANLWPSPSLWLALPQVEVNLSEPLTADYRGSGADGVGRRWRAGGGAGRVV